VADVPGISPLPPPVDSKRALSCNVYLLRRGEEATALSPLPVGAALRIDGLQNCRLVVLPTTPKEPTWFTTFAPYLEDSGPSRISRPISQPAAGLVICEVDARTFVLSFGLGHVYIKKAAVESHFGRRVTMNVVPPDKVVELGARQIFATFHHVNERAPTASAHRSFGIEGERDVVSVVEGVPGKPSRLGESVRGGTALSISIPPPQLAGALKESLRLFALPNQFAEWSEYDNLSAVANAETKALLDERLSQHLAPKPGDLILAAPDREALPPGVFFHIGRRSKNPVLRPTLYPNSFYEQVDGVPTIDDAKRIAVHFYDSDRMDLGVSIAIYDCIAYETRLKKTAYVLWSGGWYEGGLDFIKRVRNRLSTIKAPKHPLPPWRGDVVEEEYNRSVEDAGRGFKNLDRKLVRYGAGTSKFEFCDIAHVASKTLYFVKRYSSSSTMSHLVEQVRRTSELFFSPDPAYRNAMRKAGLLVPKERPRHGDWTLCLVVMGRELKELPLFAQCGIARLVRDLERAQHAVCAQKV
jgi:uncharacterized protein (TIGR04141 family)